MTTKKILVVDDEQDILDLLTYNLAKAGFAVSTASNGKEALERAEAAPDLILLDVMMPKMDGFEVVKELKRATATKNIPVIFLTAKGMEVDEVVGLELGADDYILKPISMTKLLARVKTALRRQPSDSTRTPSELDSIVIDTLEIDPKQYRVRIDGKPIDFPKKEFETLLYLTRHRDNVVTRDKLLSAVWGENVVVVDRTIDVHIRKIREKLGAYADHIETVKGVGYRFRGEE
ncbi:MAG: response regulator transcription factor [Ignavibacteriales bacterium]|nr:response regulator transcription factor [Ignavibacteriales bacterium]